MAEKRVQSHAAVACPNPNALQAYLLGQQSKNDMELIDHHVTTCKQCQTVLAKLDSARDSLVDRLRQTKRAAGVPADSGGGAALVAAAKALPRKAGAAPAVDPYLTLHFPGYRILDELGQGGCGTVYKVRNERMGNRIEALKTIKHAGDAHLLERLRQEIIAVASLEHPNIIRAYDTGEANGMLYFTMEYAAGCDLFKLVHQRGGPLPIAEACTLICQAADGLQCAHDKNIIHRDVKPSNLILTEHGFVKVLDLGLARLLDQTENGAPLTGAGAVGTPGYMAPEQLRDTHNVSPSADIYSLGCALHYLLTKQHPFRGSLAAVPNELRRILDRMTADDAGNRHPSMRAVIEDLQPFRFLGPVSLETMQKPQPAAAGGFPLSPSTAGKASQSTAAKPVKTVRKVRPLAPSTAVGAPPPQPAGSVATTASAPNPPGSNPAPTTQQEGGGQTAAKNGKSFAPRHRFGISVGCAVTFVLGFCMVGGIFSLPYMARLGPSRELGIQEQVRLAPKDKVIFDSTQFPAPAGKDGGKTITPKAEEINVPSPSPPEMKTILVGRALPSWHDKVSLTLDRVEFRNDKRMRWQFTLLNQSPAALNFWVSPGHCFATDQMGQRCNGIEHSMQGNVRFGLPVGQKVKYWIDFHEPAADAASLTARFDRDSLGGVGWLPPIKILLAKGSDQPTTTKIPLSRKLDSWDKDMTVYLESIELQPEGWMRWRLSFWNQSNRRMQCWIGPQNCYVTDQNGKRFAGLEHSLQGTRRFNILEGEKLFYWIDFDGPSAESTILTAHFDKDSLQGVGKLPQEVTVPIKGDFPPLPPPPPPKAVAKKAVDLSGRWVGTFAQDGQNFTLPFEMTLTQTGNEVPGKTSLTGLNGIETKAMEIAGTLDGLTLSFQETKYLKFSKFPGIKGELKLIVGDDMAMKLTGAWLALPPIKAGGQLRLQKK